jgi:acyl carrier protein
MGLDGVEIVLEAERRFGVALEDAECARVTTVADLAALVWAKLPRRCECPSARRFYELRVAIVEAAGVERRAVRPGTRLDAIIPRGARRRVWRRLRARDAMVPRLVWPAWVDDAMLWVAGALCMGAVMVLGVACGAGGVLWGLVALAAMFVTGGVLVWGAGAWAPRLPEGCATVGDLVRWTVPVGVPDGAGERLIAQVAVLERVRAMVSEELGMPLEKVQPESRFVKDLGVG